MSPSVLVDSSSTSSSAATKDNLRKLAQIDHGHQLESLCHGPITLKGIPAFSSHKEHRQHILVHMAATFRHWARLGFAEGISGHISVRDPEFSDCIWMNPLGRHFSLLSASDMVCVEIGSGNIVGGNRSRPVNKPGYFIHSEIHKSRPDVHAICHAHTIAGRAWCAFGKPLEMLTQDVCNFYECLAVDEDYGGIVAADEEGRRIARTLGARNKAALLTSHGLLTVGTTVDEAGFMFGLLDRSCAIQLQVEAACNGNPSLRKVVIPHEQAEANFRMVSEPNWLYVEAQPDLDMEVELAGQTIWLDMMGLEIER